MDKEIKKWQNNKEKKALITGVNRSRWKLSC